MQKKKEKSQARMDTMGSSTDSRTAPTVAPDSTISDADVVAAIRANHLKANIGWCEGKRSVTLHWDRAWADPGGTVFGSGPYLHVPITNYWGNGEETVHRVYPPARLRRRLALLWPEMETVK